MHMAKRYMTWRTANLRWNHEFLPCVQSHAIDWFYWFATWFIPIGWSLHWLTTWIITIGKYLLVNIYWLTPIGWSTGVNHLVNIYIYLPAWQPEKKWRLSPVGELGSHGFNPPFFAKPCGSHPRDGFSTHCRSNWARPLPTICFLRGRRCSGSGSGEAVVPLELVIPPCQRWLSAQRPWLVLSAGDPYPLVLQWYH